MREKALTSEELTDLIAGLNKLARNLWWTWDQGAQEIFQELSPRAWQNLYHNAVAILHEVSEPELRVRLEEPDFWQTCERCCGRLRRTWRRGQRGDTFTRRLCNAILWRIFRRSLASTRRCRLPPGGWAC